MTLYESRKLRVVSTRSPITNKGPNLGLNVKSPLFGTYYACLEKKMCIAYLKSPSS